MNEMKKTKQEESTCLLCACSGVLLMPAGGAGGGWVGLLCGGQPTISSTGCAAGNIKPLLALDYPNCMGHQQPYSCSQSAADSATYVEVRAGGWGAGR